MLRINVNDIASIYSHREISYIIYYLNEIYSNSEFSLIVSNNDFYILITAKIEVNRNEDSTIC